MSSAKHKALDDLMRPLARWCLRHSMQFQDLEEIAKLALVEVAKTDLEQRGEKVTASRLCLITGLQRREVTRLLEQKYFNEERSNPVVSRVIGQWEGDKRFRKKNGAPAVLSCEGSDSKFHALVRLVTTNVNPASVLKEMERLKIVEITKRGVKLLRGGQVFSKDWPRAMNLTAQDIGTLIQSVEENVERGSEDWNLHLRTECDNIYGKNVPEIREWLINQGKEFHRAARAFLGQFDKDINPGAPEDKAGTKVTLQAFSLVQSPPEKLNSDEIS